MNKEIVIIMGYNAAGKSTLVEQYVRRGYYRLNRDVAGKSLDDLAKTADEILYNNPSDIVLDNTYPSVGSRQPIIRVAKNHEVPIKCVHLTTSFEDAQLNACLRMMKKVGKILNPEDFKKVKDPNLFPPAAIYHYRKEFQPPTLKEGFSAIEEVPFVRSWGSEYRNKALLLDYDGTLRTHSGAQKYPCNPSEISILPGRKERLKEYLNKGYKLLGASNQSGVAKGSVSEEAVVRCFEQTNNLLEINIEYKYCPHPSNPIVCYCRKPGPGMGAYFIAKYKLSPSECIFVGDMTSDKTFATRCGFQYVNANEFFK